ncbi:hypothetical protein MASR1M49_35370 [Pararhodobacter aggregans]
MVAPGGETVSGRLAALGLVDLTRQSELAQPFHGDLCCFGRSVSERRTTPPNPLKQGEKGPNRGPWTDSVSENGGQ